MSGRRAKAHSPDVVVAGRAGLRQFLLKVPVAQREVVLDGDGQRHAQARAHLAKLAGACGRWGGGVRDVRGCTGEAGLGACIPKFVPVRAPPQPHTPPLIPPPLGRLTQVHAHLA